EAVADHPSQRRDDEVAKLALHVGAPGGLVGAGEVAADAQQRGQDVGGLGRQGDAGGAAGEVVQGRGGRARQALPASDAGSAVHACLVGADHVSVSSFLDVAGNLLAELTLVGVPLGSEFAHLFTEQSDALPIVVDVV